MILTFVIQLTPQHNINKISKSLRKTEDSGSYTISELGYKSGI